MYVCMYVGGVRISDILTNKGQCHLALGGIAAIMLFGWNGKSYVVGDGTVK